MKRLNHHEVRELIRQLNRVDLDRAEYQYIRQQINRLFDGLSIRGITPHKSSRLYRGIKYQNRPLETKQLGYPPPELVMNYQRCNPPNQPVFYCSPDPACVLYELNVQPNDLIYLSKWSVNNDFYILQLFPKEDLERNDQLQDTVLTFIETRFTQRIHAAYSNQYKITSAIAERMSSGEIVDSIEMKALGIPIGAMSYPSVSHPGRSENLAIRPEIVDKCLQLDYVEELKIEEVRDGEIKYSRTNFSSNFADGRIEWANKPLHWNVSSGSTITITKEPDGWIARSSDGSIINPG